MREGRTQGRNRPEHDRSSVSGRKDPQKQTEHLASRKLAVFSRRRNRWSHEARGPDGDHHRTLQQRDFPQESPEEDPPRSIVSFREELDHDPVLVCDLHSGNELREEGPRVSTQTQRELATWLDMPSSISSVCLARNICSDDMVFVFPRSNIGNVTREDSRVFKLAGRVRRE